MHLSPVDVEAEFTDPPEIVLSTLKHLHDLKQYTMNVIKCRKWLILPRLFC